MTDKPLYEQLAEIGASKPEAWESLERVTIDRETLQAAIDALEAAPMAYRAPDTVKALRAALAAQPVEPVARVRVHMTGGNAGIAWSAVPVDDAPLMRDGDLLYAAPPAPAAVPPDERIRVLREALEAAQNGLAWYQDSCPELVTECDHETMARIAAALEQTK